MLFLPGSSLWVGGRLCGFVPWQIRCCDRFWRRACGCLVTLRVMGEVLFVTLDVNLFCLISQVGGVRVKAKNKTRSTAGIHLISGNLPIPLNMHLPMVLVVLLTFSLVIDMRFFPLRLCGVIRCEDVLKMVSAELW